MNGDKTLSDCVEKFDNKLNFKGDPDRERPTVTIDAEAYRQLIKDSAELDGMRRNQRDDFAKAAMQGQLAFSPRDSFAKLNQPQEVAEMAYRFADAMMKARSE